MCLTRRGTSRGPRSERFDRDHAALAVLLGLNGLRVSEACATNIEDLGFQRGHRTLHIIGRATSPPSSRWCRVRPARSTSLSVNATRARSSVVETVSDSIAAPCIAGFVRSGSGPGLGAVHPHMLRAGFIMAALDAGVPLRAVQIAAC